MRKVVVLFVLLFASGYVFGQIPSINEKYNFSYYPREDTLIQYHLQKLKTKELTEIQTNYLKKKHENERRFNDFLSMIETSNEDLIKQSNAFLISNGNDIRESNIAKIENLKKEIETYKETLKDIIEEKKAIDEDTKKKEKELDDKYKIEKLPIDTIIDLKYKEIYATIINDIGKKIDSLAQLNSKTKAENVFDIENNIRKLEDTKQEFISKEKVFGQKKYMPNNFFPSKAIIYRDHFFQSHYNNCTKHTNFINSLSFIRNNTNSTISTELLTDNIRYFRISFGSVLSIADGNDDGSESEEKDIEKLLNGGGNFYLDLTLPFYSNYSRGFHSFYSFFNLKIASDIKGFDNDLGKTTANYSLGSTQHISVISENKKFNFSLSMSSNICYGTKEFLENIDLPNRLFFNTNIIGTITLDNKYRFALRTNFASEPSLRTEKIAFGFQLLN